MLISTSAATLCRHARLPSGAARPLWFLFWLAATLAAAVVGARLLVRRA